MALGRGGTGHVRVIEEHAIHVGTRQGELDEGRRERGRVGGATARAVIGPVPPRLVAAAVVPEQAKVHAVASEVVLVAEGIGPSVVVVGHVTDLQGAALGCHLWQFHAVRPPVGGELDEGDEGLGGAPDVASWRVAACEVQPGVARAPSGEGALLLVFGEELLTEVFSAQLCRIQPPPGQAHPPPEGPAQLLYAHRTDVLHRGGLDGMHSSQLRL